LADSRLGRLQREVLEAFFRKETRFFLTGGAALAGFHLGHRETDDLDLFSLEDALDDGLRALTAAAVEIGASVEPISTSPDFRRRLVRRAGESVVVDLVRERVPQIMVDKPVLHGIRVDPPEEILANKLSALLSRAEIRDLVDVRALDQAGYDFDAALRAGSTKDASLTPGQLAWVLSQITIGPDAALPGGADPGELEEYRKRLIARLGRTAFPGKSLKR
jgi:hypothetical protein